MKDVFEMKTHEITITKEQIEKLKGITAATRYDAMEQVAKIIGAKTCQKKTWASTRKGMFYGDIMMDITFSKGKVKDLEFYDLHDGSSILVNGDAFVRFIKIN